MYGMIHRALRQMVQDSAGTDAWAAIERNAGVGPTEMISGEVYDDAVTLRLIAATAALTATPAEALLIEFGRFWVGFAERGSFGHILNFTGKDIATFIANLDRMHDGVRAVMPDARMPSFAVVHSAPGHIIVDYRSTRAGLEPFVRGLLLGLIDRFSFTGSVSEGAPGDGACRFEMHYAAG